MMKKKRGGGDPLAWESENLVFIFIFMMDRVVDSFISWPSSVHVFGVNNGTQSLSRGLRQRSEAAERGADWAVKA